MTYHAQDRVPEAVDMVRPARRTGTHREKLSMPKPLNSASLLVFLVLAALESVQATAPPATAPAAVEGTPKVWHPMALNFLGPTANEADDAPNPFLDYRLQVRFTSPDGRHFEVPGFFDGDGQGGGRGTCWRVRFTPDQAGRWNYTASFRSGPRIAVELAGAGTPVAFDGETGSFNVVERDPASPGFLRWGRLSYNGGHYLKFQDGPHWLKGGTDEPENLLAYKGFDDTRPSHDFAVHEEDWRPGDPDWGDGKGKAIIGALNYLASRHVNSIYFLTMNIGGDGKDVWPWIGTPDRKGAASNDNLHYDVSKLRQWDLVFAHAQRKGIALHVVFNEAEAANKRELDDGALGVERKLYYREMIARFGYHPALQWNLCEEYNIGGLDLGADQVREFAKYVRAVDPFDHPLTVHSAGDPVKALAFTFGDPDFDLTSVQINQRRIDLVAEALRTATEQAGRPLPIMMDEFTVDKGNNASHDPRDDAELQRKQKLWPTYLSGGSIEFILEGLLKLDSFKTPAREALWTYVWHAREFLEELPFWEMKPADALSRGGATIDVGVGKGKTTPLGPQVLAQPGKVYAVYLPKANPTGDLDLSGSTQAYTKRWYNPRTGIFEGAPTRVSGGGWVPLGAPPQDPDEDWVVLLQAIDQPATTSSAVFPGKSWESKRPEDLGLVSERLDALAETLGGRGCVIKDGYVVKSWGSQDTKGDIFSSAKPVLGTLLMFAIQEGKVRSVDQPLRDFGWELKPKDRDMTFRHLTTMTSGYARPERPGEAWSYNDFAIQLYQKTLFDRVFRADPAEVANHPTRLGVLGLEDGLAFRNKNRRISASVRDFARIAWFWLHQGEWAGRQLLPQADFSALARPQVPKDLPLTQPAETDDYLNIGTYGGGSDHFSQCGPGIYGFNWWFNRTGRDHPDRRTWPDAPADTFMAVGAKGNSAAMIPSLGAVLVAEDAQWGGLVGGSEQSRMNQILKSFAAAVTTTPQ